MEKKSYVKPKLNSEEFITNIYCAACGAYINGLVCEVYSEYGTKHEDGKGNAYGTWDEDNGAWHSATGGCTTWIDEYGYAREEHGGTYQNDLTFVSGGPAAGQSTADFLKGLDNGTHKDIIVKWSTVGNLSYIHQGYIQVNGNHS